MADYLIATASTCDLTCDYLAAHGVPFIPYTYVLDGEVYEDDCREESRQKVYAGMRGGDRLKTSMINEGIYEAFFDSLLAAGKDVIFLDMSKKMSVSFEKAAKGAQASREKFPQRKLYLMDTCCVSGGLGLLVKHMVEQMECGKSYEEVLAWGEANKLRVAHRFTVDDLNYLKAGGRVSNASALIGTMLSIKPVLYVPDGGTLDVVKKARGRKAALAEILRGIKEDLCQANAADTDMLILHADCLSDALWLRDSVKQAFPQIGKIDISGLGVIIGAHCGPGLLTVFYLCNGRKP